MPKSPRSWCCAQLRAAGRAPGAEPRDCWVCGAFPWVLAPMLGAASAMLELVGSHMPKRPAIGWKYANQAESTFVGQFGEAAGDRLYGCTFGALLPPSTKSAQTRPLDGFEKPVSRPIAAMRCGRLRAGERLMEIGRSRRLCPIETSARLWRDLSVGSRHTALNTTFPANCTGAHGLSRIRTGIARRHPPSGLNMTCAQSHGSTGGEQPLQIIATVVRERRPHARAPDRGNHGRLQPEHRGTPPVIIDVIRAAHVSRGTFSHKYFDTLDEVLS